MTNGSPRIIGDYVLGPLLGRGGTSEVYAATHRETGGEVALKVLRPELATDEAVMSSFVTEATRTREIVHAHVVRVLDCGRDPAGACFLVMERIAGETLAARLKTHGRLAENALRTLAAAIADGMEAAHARGIVHRDLKPGNVMLRGDQPTIVDFGIAKSLDAGSAVVTNRRVGTLAYMAPEQLTDGMITPAADVWALGVVMYEAATGTLPFDNFDGGRLPQLFDTPPRATNVSASLDRLIARCLDRSPSKRPTMRELAAALRASDEERITEDAGPIATPAPRRRRWPFAVAGIAMVAGLVTYVALPSHHAAPPPPSAPQPPPATVAPVVIESAPPPTPALDPAPTPTKPTKPTVKPKRRVPRTLTGETLD